MKTAFLLLCGCAIGCLVAMCLPLPWFRPLDQNAASVMGALCSTTLAVLGAFLLWRRQVRTKYMAVETVLVPVFEPLYVALCQLRDLSREDSATAMLSEISKVAVTSEQVMVYREKTFENSLRSAHVEARTVLTHWGNIQDAILSVNPRSLVDSLALHRVAAGADERLPRLLVDSKPRFLEQRGPQVSDEDLRLLSWAIGRIATTLNRLDQGERDTSGYDALQASRAALIARWNATDH